LIVCETKSAGSTTRTLEARLAESPRMRNGSLGLRLHFEDTIKLLPREV
jgi:hypothetical protein